MEVSPLVHFEGDWSAHERELIVTAAGDATVAEPLHPGHGSPDRGGASWVALRKDLDDETVYMAARLWTDGVLIERSAAVLAGRIRREFSSGSTTRAEDNRRCVLSSERSLGPGRLLAGSLLRHSNLGPVMDSYAPSHTPKAPALLSRIADVAYQSFKSALAQQCTDRHSLDVTVDRTGRGQPMTLRLRCHDLVEIKATLDVRHVGGNVYDVHCSIDDGSSCQVVYCLPQETEPSLQPVPRLGQKLASFVLDELEQAFGRQRLRTA